MLRVVISLVLAAHLGIAGGPASADDGFCTQSCPDDGPDGACDSTCDDCVCCVHHHAPTLINVTTELAGRTQRQRTALTTLAPLVAEPGEILHVPKTRLA